MIQGIHQLAPQATVLVVGYPIDCRSHRARCMQAVGSRMGQRHRPDVARVPLHPNKMGGQNMAKQVLAVL